MQGQTDTKPENVGKNAQHLFQQGAHFFQLHAKRNLEAAPSARLVMHKATFSLRKENPQLMVLNTNLK